MHLDGDEFLVLRRHKDIKDFALECVCAHVGMCMRVCMCVHGNPRLHDGEVDKHCGARWCR